MSLSLPIVILGTGGHAVVVADALLAAGERVLGFTDADATTHGAMLCGLPVLGSDAALDGHSPDAVRLVNGIGGVRSTALRRAVQERLQDRGWRFASVRHPAAVVSRFAIIEPGVQLLAACVVQARARVGAGCIVNTGAVIEHDVSLGDWTHVAPRAVLCGDVAIGAHSHVGAGAVVRQGIRLGAETVIGAGAVVVSDFAGGGVLIGLPARSREAGA